MTERPEKEDGLELTPFQSFILAYFTSEELDQQSKGEVFGQKVIGVGYTADHRFATNISELTTIINPDLIPDNSNRPDEIIDGFESEIKNLLKRGLLCYETDTAFRDIQHQGIYITPKGKLFVRRCFNGLEKVITNKTQYEQAVEQVQIGSKIKEELRKFRDKFVDKSQDEIVSLALRQFGPAGIATLLKLVGYGVNAKGN